MIGYKATDINGCCRGFKFEVGKTYTKDMLKEELQCYTDKVFHFCRDIFAIEMESNYNLSESRLFEVIAGDYIRINNVYGTNSLTILREICGDEKKELLNGGYCNTGYFNTGNYNSGNRNSGACNSGNWNSGAWNTGSFNSGAWNTGSFNSGNHNTGYFNTDEPFVRMFNKDTKLKRDEVHIPQFCFFDLTEWVSVDDATKEEKEAHKEEINACGGFLKNLDYKEAWRLAWNKASKHEHLMMLKLPNWDNEVFKEISGIDAEAEIANE